PCQPPKESNQQQNRRSKLEYVYAPSEPGLLLFPVLVQPSLPHALIKRRILIGSGHFAGGCGRLVDGQLHCGKHLKPSFGKHSISIVRVSRIYRARLCTIERTCQTTLGESR